MTAGPFGQPVTLAGISMNTGIADANGIEWYVEHIDGWEGATVRIPIEDRPFSDGAFMAPGFLGQKPMLVRGVAFAAAASAGPQDGLTVARNSLLAAVNLLTNTGTLIVAENPDKQVTCRLAAAPRMNDIPPMLQWEVPLVAADPRKFSAVASTASVGLPASSGGLTFPATAPFTFGASGTPGQMVLSNAGNIKTSARFTIAGPVTNPAIQHVESNSTLTFSITLAGGDQLVVDTSDRTIILNGTASRRNTLAIGSQWFDLAPGTNTIRFMAGAYQAAALLSVTWRSAWL